MNSHYFTDNRHLPENRKEITFRFWHFSIQLQTDSGVFSKDGVDFGTRVLIQTLLQEEKRMNDRLLDVGCGYGPIGISMKLAFPEKSVTMIDVNPRAVELAKINAKNNEADVDVMVSDVYEEIKGHTFTDIITNPPIRAGKEIVYKIFAEAYELLDMDGNLWVVIRKAQGAKSAITYITSIFSNCEIVTKEKGYFILFAKKRIDNLTKC